MWQNQYNTTNAYFEGEGENFFVTSNYILKSESMVRMEKEEVREARLEQHFPTCFLGVIYSHVDRNSGMMGPHTAGGHLW